MEEPNIWWEGTDNYTPGNFGIEALFPHWTCGGFWPSVRTLQDPSREASAHYVIEGNDVAQLIDESDSAWHCGNYYYNMRAISYELVGWPGNPPSYETLDTCAYMMAQASHDYFDGADLVLGENVMLHRWVRATDCPGETDIDYLIEKANQILHGEEGEDDDMIPIENFGGDMYRLFNPYEKEKPNHHFTLDKKERDELIGKGWRDEGVAFHVSRGNVIPVFRLYNKYNGDHAYRIDVDEVNSMRTNGWKLESVPFFAKENNESGTYVYFIYNRWSGEHFMTKDKSEHDKLVKAGWTSEGGIIV